MKIKDYFYIANRYLKSKPQRTLLTIMGVAIAIVLIVSLMLLGESLKRSVSEQFSSMNPTLVFIAPKTANMFMAMFQKSLEKKDCSTLNSYEFVKECHYYIFKNAIIKYKNYKTVSSISIVDKNFINNIESLGFSLYEGRKPKNDKEVILGYLYSTDKIMGKAIKLNDKIEINNETYRVVGFLEQIGNPQDDSTVYLIDNSKTNIKISALIVLLKDLSYLDQLKKRFDHKKGMEMSYLTKEAMIEQTNTLISIVNYGVIAVAIISLIVGSIGISNTLFTNVYEMQKDIGIMKAIGARNKDIFSIVMTQTMIISFWGAIIGILTGVVLYKIIIDSITNFGLKMPFVIDYTKLSISLIFSLLLGFIAALEPSKKATKMDPIEAIRK